MDKELIHRGLLHELRSFTRRAAELFHRQLLTVTLHGGAVVAFIPQDFPTVPPRDPENSDYRAFAFRGLPANIGIEQFKGGPVATEQVRFDEIAEPFRKAIQAVQKVAGPQRFWLRYPGTPDRIIAPLFRSGGQTLALAMQMGSGGYVLAPAPRDYLLFMRTLMTLLASSGVAAPLSQRPREARHATVARTFSSLDIEPSTFEWPKLTFHLDAVSQQITAMYGGRRSGPYYIKTLDGLGDKKSISKTTKPGMLLLLFLGKKGAPLTMDAIRTHLGDKSSPKHLVSNLNRILTRLIFPDVPLLLSQRAIEYKAVHDRRKTEISVYRAQFRILISGSPADTNAARTNITSADMTHDSDDSDRDDRSDHEKILDA